MRTRYLALLLFGLTLLSSSVGAQGTTGQIVGRIVDAQGLAVPGATVTVSGPQGAKTIATSADGRFNVPFLTPGVYSVKAELQGFKAVEQKDINVSLGGTSEVALKMDVGGVTETVQVTGAVRTIDTATTTIGATLSTDQLADLPVGRRVADVMYLAPGVSSSGTLGRMNPSISGGSGLENQYVVDGTNVTNVGYGGLGSYSIVFGSLGNATPYDFVQEVQVKTGGFEAEYGQSTGGVVNVVTKSGSNLYRGSLFTYGQPSSFQNAYKQTQSSNGTINTVAASQTDSGGTIGGPIFRNHLFFFGAVDPSFNTTTYNAPPGFALASLGDVNRERRTISYAAKATLQASSSHKIDASFFGDPSHGNTGPQRLSSLLRTSTSGFSTLDYGGHQQTVRYDGIVSSHFLLEASFARSDNTISELPSVNTWAINDQTVTPTIVSGGIGRYEKGNESLNRMGTIKATNVFGGHQIKYGFEYSNVAYNQFNNITGPTFVGPDGRTTATGASITILPDVTFGKIYRVTRANYNNGHNTTQKYYDAFVQDSWRVGRLTINPGLRFDQESMDGDLIKGWELKNNLAPRVGATFDATGDGKTKIYGNYGIYYNRVPNDLAARALSADDGYSRIDFFDAGLTRFIPAGTVTRTSAAAAPTTTHSILLGAFPDDVDPNAKMSYNNEIVLGFEREIMDRTTFGVRYVFRNTGRVLEDITDCPMAAYELPATAAVPCGVTYILTNPTSSSPINAQALALAPQLASVKFDDPIHRYNSIEFTLNRRGTNWTGNASYRYSRLRGNFEGFYRDDNTQSDPGISSLYDFPTNDPTYVANFPGEGNIQYLGQVGILPLDRPHQVKLFGNYVFPKGLNVGMNINLSSGKPLTPMAANPVYDSAGEIPTAPRGSGIQTVDGFLTRTPFESQLDLQASWALKIGGSRRITFTADVFNLFNQTRTIGYDQDTELNASTANVDFGKPVNSLLGGTPPQFQIPRALRVGARFEF
jgi:Carboxypeptidase regulatory-like domain/TonB-dependent Receptor Plug Domain